MDYKSGKIAQEIIKLQNADGTWGNEFHSLAAPNRKQPLTTEQALRRLRILGFTIQDAPIRKAVDCMISCLRGERKIDNYWEKTTDWELYTKLMLSTWIKIFEPDNEVAMSFAKRWGSIIVQAFEGGTYNREMYQKAYQQEFYQDVSGKKEVDFGNFYEMNLLQGILPGKIESNMLDYIISCEKGIYYIYQKPINQLPDVFESIETSRYLAAVEILSGYQFAKEKLGFVVEWLGKNADENGQWDLGARAKDNVYFPLSDSWRTAGYRKADCTARISMILQRLSD